MVTSQLITNQLPIFSIHKSEYPKMLQKNLTMSSSLPAEDKLHNPGSFHMRMQGLEEVVLDNHIDHNLERILDSSLLHSTGWDLEAEPILLAANNSQKE